jgi:hypothetical protein
VEKDAKTQKTRRDTHNTRTRQLLMVRCDVPSVVNTEERNKAGHAQPIVRVGARSHSHFLELQDVVPIRSLIHHKMLRSRPSRAVRQAVSGPFLALGDVSTVQPMLVVGLATGRRNLEAVEQNDASEMMKSGHCTVNTLCISRFRNLLGVFGCWFTLHGESQTRRCRR